MTKGKPSNTAKPRRGRKLRNAMERMDREESRELGKPARRVLATTYNEGENV